MLSDTIKSRLAERFHAPLPDFYKRRIVFWHDENGEFAEEVDELSLPGVTLVKLTGRNNFAVKKLLTADDLTGDYLLYNPIVYDRPQDNWLWDIELYSGDPFLADLISMQMEELNIESTSAMRKTVKLYSKFFDNKDRKAKLKKIGRSYHTPLSLHVDIMAVLCGLNGGTAQDVIIAVLTAGLDKTSNTALKNITSFGNAEAFWQMVQKFTGYADSEEKELSELAAHILITALSQTISVTALKGLERFISESCTAYCYQLIREWQFSDDNNALYEICHYVERELRLADRFDKIDIDVLLKSDTLPSINESILKRLFTEIGVKVIRVDEILRTVENRRTSAWYNLSADYFDCLHYTAKMQEFYLAHIEGFHIVEPKGIWKKYIAGAYQMDSHYRHFHYAFGNTLKAPNALLDDELRVCMSVVEGLYRQWFLSGLTAAWTKAIKDDLQTLGYITDISKQRDFYKNYVLPIINKGKDIRACVIISDALRYEVAVELAERLSLSRNGKASIESVQSVLPGVTSFGMAALLPGKEISVNEKNEVFKDGMPTRDTPQREKVLLNANDRSVAVTFNDLLRKNKQQRRDVVTGKKVVYIYHNAIDTMGEKLTTEAKVFEACRTAVDELAELVRFVVDDMNTTYVFITSDHGFLYTYDALDESQKISQKTFDGDVYDIGTRYALTAPCTTSEHLLPINMDGEIVGMPMMGYAPQDTIRIKVQGGGKNYVHGGISLQEMVVPVIAYHGMRLENKHYVEVKNPGLTLISESRKVANLMFSLDFLQKQAVGEKVQPCVYTVHFTDDEGAAISDRQTVIADKTSTNASERVFRIRFNLKSIAFDRNKIYRLVIANETDVPEEIEFRIDIAFADDFGFNL